MRQAQAGAERQHRASLERQLRVGKGFDIALDESHLRADRAQRHIAGEGQRRSAGRIEQVLTALADERARKLRQPHLWKQPIDQRLLVLAVALVEEAGPLDRVAPGDAVFRRDAQPDFGTRLATVEVEARSTCLIDQAGNEQIGSRLENTRFAIRGEDPVLVEAAAAISSSANPLSDTTRSLVRSATRVKKLTDRFLPPMLRRPYSKEPRGTNSYRSSAVPASLFSSRDPTSRPPPNACVFRGASSTRTTTSRVGPPPRWISVMRTRRNSPSAVRRCWLSMTADDPSGSPGFNTSSRSIVFELVRWLPTMMM